MQYTGSSTLGRTECKTLTNLASCAIGINVLGLGLRLDLKSDSAM